MSRSGVAGFDSYKGLCAASFYSTCQDSIVDSIALFSIDGTTKRTWELDHFDFGYTDIEFVDSNKFFIACGKMSESPKVISYDTLGNKLSETIIPIGTWADNIVGMAYNSQKQWLYVAVGNSYGGGRVYLFDGNYSIITHYDVVESSSITSIGLQNNGSLFIGVGHKIIKLKPLNR
jgi:hypothetical protein